MRTICNGTDETQPPGHADANQLRVEEQAAPISHYKELVERNCSESETGTLLPQWIPAFAGMTAAMHIERSHEV